MEASAIVKRIRSLSGITRKELAGLAALSPSTVGRIERDEIDPTWGTLSSILAATGYEITGRSIAATGDTSALEAARPWLSAALRETQPPRELLTRSSSNEWWDRWRRAGWLSTATGVADVFSIAIVAGNTAKVSRRRGAQLAVAVPDGWQALARSLTTAGIDYAVSGLVATRKNRSTATAHQPLLYVSDPGYVSARFASTPAPPGTGVLLVEPSGEELSHTQLDEGIRFASLPQALLDALAGAGREPDKAENELRKLLAAA